MNKTPIPSRAGFTLAELLAAMMVFSIIMLACANLVNQAGLSFKLGLNQVETQDTGRVLNQEFFRTLSGAVTAARYPFFVKKDFTTDLEGGGADALFCVTSSSDRFTTGSLQEILCWVEGEEVAPSANKQRGKLYMRNNFIGRGASGANPGDAEYGNEIYDSAWKSSVADVFASGNSMSNMENSYASLLAENVWSFKVRVYDFDGNEVTSDYDSKTTNDELPARIDIEIEVLDEETWAKHEAPNFATLAANNLKTIRFSQSYANKGIWE